jgi:uncharacterized protein YceH (UPF0502 family)
LGFPVFASGFLLIVAMTFTASSAFSASSSSAPTPSSVPAQRPLTVVEARVLGTLMEKARTVPDSYPLSMQSLLTGCNQKTTREPVMNLNEAEAALALDELRQLNLVHDNSGTRVPRYSHNIMRTLALPEQSAVLLGLLMLRGPQTAAELRLNAERWYRFADISSVEGFLEELQDRSEAKGGPLTLKLPRAPGAREQRWAHLLCGPVDTSHTAVHSGSAHAGAGPAPAELAALAQRVHTLEQQVARLTQQLETLIGPLDT